MGLGSRASVTSCASVAAVTAETRRPYPYLESTHGRGKLSALSDFADHLNLGQIRYFQTHPLSFENVPVMVHALTNAQSSAVQRRPLIRSSDIGS